MYLPHSEARSLLIIIIHPYQIGTRYQPKPKASDIGTGTEKAGSVIVSIYVLISIFYLVLQNIIYHILHLNLNMILQSSLDAHSVQVVVISFGCQEGASHWMQETGCQFDMLLDSDRKVRGQHQVILQKVKLILFYLIDKSTVCSILQMYTAFGLGASLKKVLNFTNMLLYAEYVADNFEFPRGLASIEEDMFQVHFKV